MTRKRQVKEKMRYARKNKGSSSWIDFKSHFEVNADLKKWTIAEKGMYLVVALRGQAKGVYGKLSTDFSLEEWFVPSNQT